MRQSPNSDRTSIGLRRSTYQRLDDLRPFDSMAWDEYLSHLADVYEEHQG